jgi:sigma-B regulation protein RsbU (phosphoserine phosphatase)
MKVLIAEDEELSRCMLEAFLSRRGYEVLAVADGVAAWDALQAEDRPPLAILDWMMPGIDGVELCRRSRSTPALRGLYLMLLTARDSRESILAGLGAGANDYITKPFDAEELDCRLRVAAQMVDLQGVLAARVHELEHALAEVKLLRGLLPICCYCKSVRDDRNYWHKVEQYLADHSDAQVTSGICPACWDKEVKPLFVRLGKAPPQHPSS